MASGGFVRINFAPAEELLTVPGIGPNIAAAIVELRISRSNMTPEFLKLLLRGKIPKGALECLDFTPNHKFSSDEDYNPALAERADAEQQTSTYGRGYISEPDSEGSSRVSDLEDDQHVKTFMRQLDDAVTLRPPPNPELVKMEAVKARPPPKRHVKQMEPVGPLNRAIDVDRQRQDHRQRYREPYGVHDDYEVYADEYEPQHLNVRPPRGVNILNTLPRNLQYDGKSTWMAFEQKFTRYAQSSAWSANQCLDSLCWCLTGKASDFCATLLERQPAMAYRQLLHRLSERFGAKELPASAQARFQQATQNKGEGLEEWADRVLTLATKAFAELPEQYSNQQAISRFCQGLQDSMAGHHVCMQRSTSIEQAMNEVRLYQHTRQSTFGKHDTKCSGSLVDPEYETPRGRNTPEAELPRVRSMSRTGGKSGSRDVVVGAIVTRDNGITERSRDYNRYLTGEACNYYRFLRIEI